MKIINGVKYGSLLEVILWWSINLPIAIAMIYGAYAFDCWLLKEDPPPVISKQILLLPSTCYFINNSSMQEINMVCQRGTREDFLFCVNWTWHLDYDVCDDYYNLWMEEYHVGQTISDEGFME